MPFLFPLVLLSESGAVLRSPGLVLASCPLCAINNHAAYFPVFFLVLYDAEHGIIWIYGALYKLDTAQS